MPEPTPEEVEAPEDEAAFPYEVTVWADLASEDDVEPFFDAVADHAHEYGERIGRDVTCSGRPAPDDDEPYRPPVAAMPASSEGAVEALVTAPADRPEPTDAEVEEAALLTELLGAWKVGFPLDDALAAARSRRPSEPVEGRLLIGGEEWERVNATVPPASQDWCAPYMRRVPPSEPEPKVTAWGGPVHLLNDAESTVVPHVEVDGEGVCCLCGEPKP